MENAKRYVGALEHQKKVFQLFQDFINQFEKDEVPGYLSYDNVEDNSIDITIGSDRFTILANIQQDGKIIFNVFLWEFDLSSLTRYTGKNVDQLILIKDGASLVFKNTQYDYKNKDFTVILDITKPYTVNNIEPFFNQVEIYMKNKDELGQWRAY